MLDRRTNEDQASVLACFREHRTFGEEAVAGMDSITTLGDRRCDNRRLIEIRTRATTGQRHDFMRHRAMPAVGVIKAVNGNAGEIEIGESARDTHGDFAAIGD